MVRLNLPEFQKELESIPFSNLPVPSFLLLMLWERLLSLVQVNQWPQWMLKVWSRSCSMLIDWIFISYIRKMWWFE